jgi:protein gp37
MTANGGQWTGKVELIESALDIPLRRKKPTTWFVNSMSDLFHESLPDEDVYRVFAIMERCPQHKFQVLTKRAARLPVLVKRIYGSANMGRVLPNVWLGVSCEDQKTADERIPLLIQTPAALRFISCEPLLSAIDLRKYLSGPCEVREDRSGGGSLDNQVGHQCRQESDTIQITADGPGSQFLPPPTRPSGIPGPGDPPAEMATNPLQNFRVCAVDGNSGTVCPAGPSAPIDIPFPIEHPGDIRQYGGIAGYADREGRQPRSSATGGDSKTAESPLHCGARSPKLGSEGFNGSPAGVSGGESIMVNYGRPHTPHYITWVVCGGESGPGARPCDVSWIRSVVKQCLTAEVACFVKQLGSVPVIAACRQHHWDFGESIGKKAKFSAMDSQHPSTGLWRVHLEDHKGGDPSEWAEDLRVRQIPKEATSGVPEETVRG